MLGLNGRTLMVGARVLCFSAIALALSACSQKEPLPAKRSAEIPAPGLNSEIAEVVIAAPRVDRDRAG